MKKILVLLTIFAWVLVGCEDILDTQPYDGVPSDEAITNARGVENAINGCYSAMQSVGYYARHYIVFGDLAADNLTWTGTHDGYDQVNRNSILADNVHVEGIWSSIYTAINRVNNVVVQIPGVEDMDQDSKNEAIAELRFLRALHHYNLMRMFGPIPVRTEPATEEEESLNVPRVSITTEDEESLSVLDQINSDLDFAIENMSPVIFRGRASRAAAEALKARVSLHEYFINDDISHLEDAVTYSTNVIDNYNLELETDFGFLFSGESNTESIFEVAFTEVEDNRLSFYFFPTSMSGRREIAPTQSLFDSYADDDERRDVSIQMDGEDLYGNKYTDIETGTDNVYVFRLAEMYLIRAEAEALMEGDVDQIQSDINEIRERAGLLETTVSNYDVLLLEIETQRRKEFAFEGHRWFDLVRTNRAIDVLENVNDVYQTLFPIPLSELLANDHEGMYQNDGYGN